MAKTSGAVKVPGLHRTTEVLLEPYSYATLTNPHRLMSPVTAARERARTPTPAGDLLGAQVAFPRLTQTPYEQGSWSGTGEQIDVAVELPQRIRHDLSLSDDQEVAVHLDGSVSVGDVPPVSR